MSKSTLAGVYLSQNGNIIQNNSDIFITQIGTSSGNPLVCTSDRMPCCQATPQYGEWKLSDESLIKHISEGPNTFHRNRDKSGNVNLFRVNNAVTSPTGRFCCEVEDATGTNQTLCIRICKLLIKNDNNYNNYYVATILIIF